MNMPYTPGSQRGATLIAGLIMLAVIMLTVTTAFTLSSTNVKAVGNMQFRNEAVAAANKAIEQVISSPFTNSPAAEEINVDLNNDGNTDYVVQITRPTCVRASQLTNTNQRRSSLTLRGLSGGMAYYNTMWEIEAVVNDAISGTAVRVHQGVRVVLDQTKLNEVCA
ncbi:MAG TPA: hypothetical protein VEC01_15895 [Noviherbaspirillum sp.]|uniref:pilus assembly PilX family protein n=1 Tax=Noviherbaspirillum sp. TaxID=1926288 RepID=UPI002D4230BB|nr:hypothetical protein [Noviherbaspirillum sp.]HYD96812.1 hypothetical protein [Noviherbaspirillum sp.]